MKRFSCFRSRMITLSIEYINNMYAIKIAKRLSNDFGKQHFKEVHLRLLSFTTELHVDRIGEQFGIKKSIGRSKMRTFSYHHVLHIPALRCLILFVAIFLPEI